MLSRKYSVPLKRSIITGLVGILFSLVIVLGVGLSLSDASTIFKSTWLVVSLGCGIGLFLWLISGTTYAYALNDVTLQWTQRRVWSSVTEIIDLELIDRAGLTDRRLLIKPIDLIAGKVRFTREYLQLWPKKSREMDAKIESLLEAAPWSMGAIFLQERHLMVQLFCGSRSWLLPITRLNDRTAFVRDLMQELESSNKG